MKIKISILNEFNTELSVYFTDLDSYELSKKHNISIEKSIDEMIHKIHFEQDKENFTQILKNYPELINPNQYDLSDIFEKLKIGRSSDEQEYINDCILKFKNK
jgi:hypothetical protein